MALDEEAGHDQIDDVADAMLETGIDFRVLVDGDFAIAQLADYFDRPFDSLEGSPVKVVWCRGDADQEKAAV